MGFLFFSLLLEKRKESFAAIITNYGLSAIDPDDEQLMAGK
jgi:hypothetical protein